MGEIVNEVMKAFGQQVSFKKTEVMMIKSDRKKEVDVIVEAEEQGREDVFLMEGNIIKMVKQFKYLGT